jgi:Tfp pilus assembly protein FimT
MCISSNQSSCDGTTADEWNKGWIVFSDFDGDGTVDTTDGDTILKREPASPEGLTIKSAAFTSSITIAPRGRLRSQGSFVICDSTGDAENGMALNLWVTGLGRLATDSNNDGIVENLAGQPISCQQAATTSTSD